MKPKQILWRKFTNRLKSDPEYFAYISNRLEAHLKETENGCLEWTGFTGKNGYGSMTVFSKGGPFFVHRIAFALAHPDFEWIDQHICHRCDNPPCCNDDHLFSGTMKDNIADCIQKGRFKFPKPRKGTSHPHHKLSDEDVRFIIEHFRPKTYVGEWTRDSLAKRFNVAPATIYRIANGRAWSHHGGTRNKGNSYLSDEQKKIIRERHTPGLRRGPGTRSSLAKLLGVPPHAVSNYITQVHEME